MTSVELVELAASAGAKYIISPDTNIDVIKRTRELGLVLSLIHIYERRGKARALVIAVRHEDSCVTQHLCLKLDVLRVLQMCIRDSISTSRKPPA